MAPKEIIATLGMQRHPEGGWYVETFRDTEGGARGHSTAIYYLLEKGERSHWHRVRDAVEIWHHYAGGPLRLSISGDGQVINSHVLGNDLPAGERPQVLVPAGWWQCAEPLGDWSLVGCTVAPGFSFDAFEMAPPDWRPGL
ncbi:cupin domain-containing protein [Rhizobium sp. GN54]|uniref:cupin domain-containing protein n=1 Tax=Rhizobium sp. GN54 TaxID=2898150 RepID=UPI001E3A7576|nr:cupin domain-containing protein [Rhizobium sp. GN54]MCD2182313.1 cupin domain-containing protein [Rhizobium sp. GN54]